MIFNKSNNFITEFKNILNISMSADYNTIVPYLNEGKRLIIKYTGNELYNVVDDYYNYGDGSNLLQNKLVELMQTSLLALSYYQGYDLLILKISNGISLNQAKEANIPFLRQELNAKNKLLELGYNALEEILSLLDAHIEEFNVWKNSEENKKLKNYFLQRPADYEKYISIANSRILFNDLLHYQRLTEDFEISPLIGIDLMNELKTQLLNNSLSDSNRLLVTEIQKVSAYKSIERAGLNFQYKLFEKEQIANSKMLGTEYKIDDTVIDLLKEKIKDITEIANSYLSQLESFIKKFATNYPLYYNSSYYRPTKGLWNFENKGKKIAMY